VAVGDLDDFLAETVTPALQSALGDTVVHWPRGREADAENVAVQFDRSDMQAEFTPLDGDRQRKQMLRMPCGVPKTVDVTHAEAARDCSVLVIDGDAWTVERLLGEDPGDDGLRYFLLVRALGSERSRSPMSRR
jgi:hypothetical protein